MAYSRFRYHSNGVGRPLPVSIFSIAMGFFMAIARLTQFCEDHRRKPPQMTKAELREGMTAHVEELIRAHPELAVECARQIGWAVEPIGD